MLRYVESGDIDALLDTFHEDAVYEIPYLKMRIEGKAAVEQTMRVMLPNMEGHSYSDVVLQPMLNPQRVLAQMRGRSRIVSTGRDYDQTYICLYEIRDGKVALLQEYVDTQVVASAFTP
jgi:ketosteroid isomerase-like protein